MRSILTLEGVGAAPKRKKKSKTPRPPSEFGTCKKVHNPRTKRTLTLCFVGKTWDGRTVPTGWRLMSEGDLKKLEAEKSRRRER